MSSKSKEKCLHENRKTISSNHNPYDKSNHLYIQCMDCDMRRYESRHPNGRIDTSRWFTLLKLKEK